MKKSYIVTLVAVSSLTVACNNGGSSLAQAQSGQQLLTTQAYIDSLKQVDLSNETDLNLARNNLIAYYGQVQVDKTTSSGGVVIDCVPFNQQPALINVDTATREHALMLSQQSVQNGQVCPSGNIGVVRVPVRVFTNKLHAGIFKHSVNNVLPYDDGGYMYYQSSNATLINQDNQGIFVAINAGSDMADIQNSSNNPQHYLQQEWWISGSGSNIASLETGIITSNYFSTDSSGNPIMTKSIFVFSTPNAYSDSTTAGNNANQYNLAGGFIQTNNLITFGAPIGNQQYVLSYLKKSDGYHLLVSPVTLNASGNYQMGATTDIGYWPIERYSGYGNSFPYPPNFTALTSGFEIDQQNTTAISSTPNDGTLIGYGTTNSNGAIGSFASVSGSTFGGIQMPFTANYTPSFNAAVFYDNQNNAYDINTLGLAGTFQ